MNTLPPNEPLDDQEREFARILLALPSGEPSPALDAKILRAATNAAASSKRPVRRVLASAGALWGIGSAAAAVLALGVAWQLRYGAPDHAAAPRAPRALAVSVSDDGSVQVVLSSQPADAPFVAPAPPPPMEMQKPATAKLRRAPAQPASGLAAPAPAAAAEPEAFARDHLDEHVSSADAALAAREQAAAAEGARAEEVLELKGRAADDARQRAAKMAASNAAAAAPAMAEAAPPAVPPPASRADTESSAAGYASGGLVAQKAEADTRKPGTWLADIRKLRDQGHIQEARASLVEFRKKYPKWVVPTDLAPLLSE
jgi:hypothetical protein